MQVTIDISMYPNREDFIPPIKGFIERINQFDHLKICLLYTSPSPRDQRGSRMPSSA